MKIMVSVCLKSEAFRPNPKPFPLTNLLCPSLAPWEKMEWWWTDTHIICKVPRIFIHSIPLKMVFTKPKFGIYEYMKLLPSIGFFLDVDHCQDSPI